MHYTHINNGTCSRSVSFDLDGDKVKNITFMGGCDGNLKAIAKLVDGWSVNDIEKALSGNTCGYKRTSCADQLAKAVREAYQKSIQNK